MKDKRYTEDPRVKGEIAEHLFVIKCLEKNVEILKPLQQNPRYDFLIKSSNGWKKVQIKYVSLSKEGRIPVSKTKGQNGRNKTIVYKDDEIDYMFVFNPETNNWYDIPFKNIERSLILNTIGAKGKQANKKNIRKAEDYILKLESI